MEHNPRAAIRHGSDRRPIACLPCRHRKLRCDRTLPACGNCINRGEITSCCYVSRKSESRTKSHEPTELSGAAQRRIDHLEQLVLSLLKNDRDAQARINAQSHQGEHEDATDFRSDQHKQSTNKPAEADHSRVLACQAPTKSSIKIAAIHKHRLSVDEAHWASLLNEIGEVRSHLRTQHRQYEEQTEKISRLLRRSCDDPGPTLPFGSSRRTSRREILTHLPPRYSCDILINRFFSNLYPAIYILHRQTFNKQYEHFWQNESTTSVVWIALLFAMLRIAMLDYIREGEEPVEFKGKCHDLAASFRSSFEDCLTYADYMKPHNFLIEALGLHLYSEYVMYRDSSSSVWVLIGMIARLAMRMGYHQASQPGLTSGAFQDEMRRRVWAYVCQADILLSFQVGLPSTVGTTLLKGPLPRNIHDDNGFEENCTTLPPTLPDSEFTQISFLIAKIKLAFGFARALQEINGSEELRLERILEIDRELRQIYNNIPNHYKLGQLSDQDSLIVISARFVLASIHHKSLCVIHSRFLEIAKQDHRYLYSRRVCLTSAMSILRFQAIQNQEIPVNGRLRSLTNYQTSLVIHDYLLAATIISVDLCSNTVDNSSTTQRQSNGVPSRTEMIKALGNAARIFSQMRDHSIEAFKAADILGMLEKKLETGHRDSIRPASQSQVPQSRQSLSSETVEDTRQCEVSQRQPSYPAVTEQCLSTTFENQVNSASAHDIHPRQPVCISPQFSQNPHFGELHLERTGDFDTIQLDNLSTWSETRDSGFCDQSPGLPGMFSTFDTATGWNAQVAPEYPMDSMIGDFNSKDSSIEFADSMFYSAGFTLSDPVSILRNLNSEM